MHCLKCDPNVRYELDLLSQGSSYWKLYARSKYACFSNAAATKIDGWSSCMVNTNETVVPWKTGKGLRSVKN